MTTAAEPAQPDNPRPRRRFLARPSGDRVLDWVAAAFGGLMVVVAMPDIGLALPIVLALPAVLVRSRTLPWRRRLNLGWLMGFAYHVILFRWLPFTLTEMTPLPLPVTWLMWWLYAAWHGLAIGVFLALAEPVRRATHARWPALSGLAVALTFVALEHVFPALFPFSLGHALWSVGPIAALQALGGVPLLALFVVLVQVALADAWTRQLASARTVGVVLLVLFGAGFGWHVHATSATPDRTLRVAIIQPDYKLAEKKKANVEQRKKFMARLDRLIRSVPRGSVDLIVASEGAFPMYWRVDAPRHAGSAHIGVVSTLQIARAVAEGPGVDAIIGGLRQGERVPSAPADSKDPTHNAAVLIGGDGQIRGHYDKRVLVPFSEYLPLSDLIPSLRGAIPGIGDFTPGERPCRFVAAGEPVACGICYETMFEDETREAARGDGHAARLIVNLTIDTWFGPNVAPWMHLMTHASRAVELGVPLVRAALTGISALVLPTGEVAASLPMDVEGVLTVEVPLTDLATPFRTTGPVVPWVALALTALALFAAWRGRRELFPHEGVGASRSRCSISSDVPPSKASPEPTAQASPRPPSEPGT